MNTIEISQEIMMIKTTIRFITDAEDIFTAYDKKRADEVIYDIEELAAEVRDSADPAEEGREFAAEDCGSKKSDEESLAEDCGSKEDCFEALASEDCGLMKPDEESPAENCASKEDCFEALTSEDCGLLKPDEESPAENCGSKEDCFEALTSEDCGLLKPDEESSTEGSDFGEDRFEALTAEDCGFEEPDENIPEEFMAGDYELDEEELAELMGEEYSSEISEERDASDISIDEMDLSVRAYNCLKRAGIDTLQQLREMKDEDLRNVRNLGERSYRHVKERMAEYGKIPAPAAEKKDYLGELNSMIGLAEVKEQVKRIAAFARLSQDMKRMGKAAWPVSFHMVFTGNPGTGKTTAARLTAGILHEIGVLSGNSVVEVGRSDLIGKYTGHTAPLVREAFRKAKGKVLFIDEAYSLIDDCEDSFGDEAINTIVQEMENRREDTVVIFAGYPDRMQEFLERNPGLASRIPYRVNFADYSAEEMLQMIRSGAERRGFHIRPAAEPRILEICRKAAGYKDAGNGRFARNQIENAILSYAERVYGPDGASGAEQTFILEAEDFRMPDRMQEEKLSNPIGFRLE